MGPLTITIALAIFSVIFISGNLKLKYLGKFIKE